MLTTHGGAALPFGEIPWRNIISGNWARKWNATSASSVDILMNEECCDIQLLGQYIPAAKYILFRDNGNGENIPVWSGTVSQVSLSSPSSMRIAAIDNSWWLQQRILAAGTYSGDATSVAAQFVQLALAENNFMRTQLVIGEDSNVVAVKEIQDDRGSRVLYAVTDVLRGVGFWTQILDNFYINRKCDLGHWTTPGSNDDMADSTFRSFPTVSYDIDNLATRIFVRTSENNVFAQVGGEKNIYTVDGSIMDTYLIDKLIDANVDDAGDAKQYGVKRLAQLSTAGPQVDSSGSIFTPTADISINTLIPGCSVQVQSSTLCGNIVSDQYLSGLDVSFTKETEEVRPQLSTYLGDSVDPNVSEL